MNEWMNEWMKERKRWKRKKINEREQNDHIFYMEKKKIKIIKNFIIF